MRELLLLFVPRLAWLYIHFVARTSDVHWFNLDVQRAAEVKHKNFLFAFWHGRQIFLSWAYRNSKHRMLISQSKDGEYIARILQLFKVFPIRGSSSRGGVKALVACIRAIRSGVGVGFTPDGPRGPQRKVAPGILFVAQKTSKPILPVTYSAKRKLVFKGWDDFWVPLPFNRIILNTGQLVYVGPDDNLEEKALELSRELNRITEEADLIVEGKLSGARAGAGGSAL